MEGGRVGAALGVVALLVGLWIFPAVWFANPGPNDAPILWTAPVAVVGLTLLASIVAVVVERARGRSATGSVALATFLVGVALAFLIGLATFANLSNDRFWPFLLSPVVFGATGIALLLAAVVGRRVGRAGATRSFVIGAAAALFLVAWMLARGSRDWLLAPYGFDVWLLIALEAAVVFVAAGMRLRRPRQLVRS